MSTIKTGYRTAWCLALTLFASSALAQTQVTSTDYSTGDDGTVTITMQTSGSEPAVSVFATDSPPRIVLDMSDTTSTVDSTPVQVNSGNVSSYSTLSAGGRTRVLVELSQSAEFDYSTSGGRVSLTVANGQAVAAAASTEARRSLGSYNVNAIDFRRGEDGQSRVIVGLDGEGASVAVNAGAGTLNVEIFNSDLPENLNQVLDVVDFATPVQIIDVSQRNESVRLEMMVAGVYEHLAYQSGNDVIIEVQAVEPLSQSGPEEVQLYEDREYTGARVTFNFQDIPVRSVLQLIADVSDLNIVVADNVSGNLTLRLTNVPWDQALDIILDARNLDKRENGNVIWIAPTSDIAAREQELLQAQQDRRELEPLVTAMLSVSYATAEDMKLLIEESSQSGGPGGPGLGQNLDDRGLLSTRGSVSIDPRTNTLLITDTQDRIEAIQNLVTELDRPVRQVQIESRIVIASSDFSHELGVRFGVNALHDGSNILAIGGDGDAADLINPATNPRDDGLIDIPGTPDRYNVNLPVTTSGAGTIGLSFLTGNFLIDLELSALEAEGEGEVISTPRVVTANQAEAFIQQGVEIPYEESTSSGASSVQFKEAVLELRVTPLITPDNRVQLDLNVKQDTVGEIFQTGRGGSVPSIDTRELGTSVLVNNGETVVLGGIFQDERSRSTDKVPYLADIPGVGNLFKRRSNSTQKRELLIFVSPTIVEDRPLVN
ncbi:type IV pilus secretin PilQ [Marinihelvus fidelis]|nr:type IV pilus secretin PilQ [Marinihelvus fidelis]